ncbi:hypothetical protein BS50DRAFT_325884 [Corynespora cassiicola Philippines]|uniref:DUF1996 domain-containing protein n=1 Tax=Corynespora cassiicola Philippines TaxID=1448308 RepID=A0A2T2NTS4_CORCC|nr:hypothetical protein BS50DRAFT_325884 [Corynespora cassiicola Philippines]
MIANLAMLTAGLAATASAFDCSGPYFSFFNRGGDAMSYQRLDPALFPGTASPHLHSFDGGNALAASMGFETTQDSSCTTARIKADKSLYWRPTLFWNGNNTGFYRVPNKYLKIYYRFGDAGNVRANVTEFPEGFSMIAGDPFKRSPYEGSRIKWACLQDNYARIDADGGAFPKGFTSCSEGLTAEITFPSCWNGKALDPKSPRAHMAYPNAGSGKGLDACPTGFKTARFPEIFIEFWYDVTAFDGQYSSNSVPWVLSNGDPTGYGFHADFMNGWEKGVLAKATAEQGYCNCGCGCGEDQMRVCFGNDGVNSNTDADFESCSAVSQYGSDDATSLDKLPGCNPIQSGPADATVASGAGCALAAATSVAAVTKASSSAAATPASSKPGSSKAAAASSVKKEAFPSLSFSIPNKQQGAYKPSGAYDAVTPTLEPTTTPYTSAPTYTSTALSDGGSLGLVFVDKGTDAPDSTPLPAVTALPSLSLAAPAAPVASNASSPDAGEEGECKAPVYVTVTPTVYVTQGVNATSCDLGTVEVTVTSTSTVTVPAGGYKHKRHGGLHHKN